MTNLKDKLAASVRQAKSSIQPSTQPVARTVRRSPVRAPAAVEPTAVVPVRTTQPSGALPMPIQITQASVPGGFAFPDRVWPD